MGNLKELLSRMAGDRKMDYRGCSKSKDNEKRCSLVKDRVSMMHPENKVRKRMFSRRINKSNKKKGSVFSNSKYNNGVSDRGETKRKTGQS